MEMIFKGQVNILSALNQHRLAHIYTEDVHAVSLNVSSRKKEIKIHLTHARWVLNLPRPPSYWLRHQTGFVSLLWSSDPSQQKSHAVSVDTCRTAVTHREKSKPRHSTCCRCSKCERVGALHSECLQFHRNQAQTGLSRVLTFHVALQWVRSLNRHTSSHSSR